MLKGGELTLVLEGIEDHILHTKILRQGVPWYIFRSQVLSHGDKIQCDVGLQVSSRHAGREEEAKDGAEQEEQVEIDVLCLFM